MTPAATGGQCLPRERRIKQPRDFARARSEGRRLSYGCLVFNWRLADGQSPARLGVVTSKRVGGAVVRNRARRLLREAFRRHQQLLRAPMDVILVARSQIAGLSYAAVERDYLAALRRAGLIDRNEPGPAHTAV